MSEINNFSTCKYIDKGAWQYFLGKDEMPVPQQASIKVSDFSQKTQQTSKGKSRHKKSNKIIVSTLIAAVVGYVVFKGFSYGPVAKWATKMADRLDDKAYELMNNNKSLSTIQKIYLASVQKIKKVLHHFNSLSNITAVKDSSLQRLGRTKGFGWVKQASGKITNAFKRIVVSAYDGVYKKTVGIVDTNSANISETINKLSRNLSPEKLGEKLSINGVEKTVAEWLNIAQIEAHSITPKFQRGFSSFARRKRIGQFEQATQDFDKIIFERIKSLREVFSKGTYITEKTARPYTRALLDRVDEIRNSISHNIDDIADFALENLSKVKSAIKPDDRISRDTIRSVQKLLKQYRTLPSTVEFGKKQELLTNITSSINSLMEKFKTANEMETVGYLNSILERLTTKNQKGSLENILTIIRAVAGKSAVPYQEITSAGNRIRTALGDMTKIENSLYNKFAELNTGSAPTDILGLAVPTATGIYLVSKSDNKEELVGSTLKQGIPILGGILTCLYCTLRMKTGIYGLALGTGTSFVLNQIGDKINNFYKKSIEENKFKSAAVEYYMKNFVNAKKS